MKITKATPQDLIEVLFLLKDCVSDLNSNGLKHWNSAFPGSDIMQKAIEEGKLYLVKDRGVAKGMAVLSEEEPKEYKNVEWQTSPKKIGFVKYLTVHPRWQHKGIAKQTMLFVEEVAKEQGFDALRFDIYGGIEAAEKIGGEFGFNKTGQFHSDFQATPYLAFEKNL